MKFIGHYKLSTLITYLSVLFGVLGVIQAYNNNLNLSVIFLMLAGISDMFDGKVARLEKRSEKEQMYGIEIDSLADIFNYTAIPITIGLSLGLNMWYCIISYILLAICAVIRLGYFNVYTSNKTKAIDTYKGLPITSIAVIIPILFLFKNYIRYFNIVYIIIIYITSLLFILDFKVPKFTSKIFYILVTILALLAIIIFI